MHYMCFKLRVTILERVNFETVIDFLSDSLLGYQWNMSWNGQESRDDMYPGYLRLFNRDDRQSSPSVNTSRLMMM